MPTTYTGNPTGVEAGDTAPEPEKFPILTVPIAGDGRTVSSILSALKNIANHLAWLFRPKAKTGSYSQPIMGFRTALGHRRALIDHLGLPGGRIQQWNEMWERGIGFGGATIGPQAIIGNPVSYDATFLASQNTLASKLADIGIAANFAAAQPLFTDAGLAVHSAALAYAAISPSVSHWLARTVQAGAGTSALGFSVPTTGATYSTRHNVASLVAGDTAGDYANLWRGSNACFDDLLSFALEWEGRLEAADLVKTSAAVGWCLENSLSVGGSLASDYAVFAMAPGGGNWFCNHALGGTGAGTDSGVAATTNWVRFRIEFHGATVADDGVRALRYYIDGVKVADITTNIPATTARAAAAACIVNTGGGSGGKGLRIGPMRFVANLYGADVA